MLKVYLLLRVLGLVALAGGAFLAMRPLGAAAKKFAAKRKMSLSFSVPTRKTCRKTAKRLLVAILALFLLLLFMDSPDWLAPIDSLTRDAGITVSGFLTGLVFAGLPACVIAFLAAVIGAIFGRKQ